MSLPSAYIVIYQEAARNYEEFPDLLERIHQLEQQLAKRSSAPPKGGQRVDTHDRRAASI